MLCQWVKPFDFGVSSTFKKNDKHIDFIDSREGDPCAKKLIANNLDLVKKKQYWTYFES